MVLKPRLPPLRGRSPALLRLAQSQMHAPSPKLIHGHRMRSRLPGVTAGPEGPARAVVLSAGRHSPSPPGFPSSSRCELSSETLGHVPPPLRAPEQALSKLSAHTGTKVRTRTQEPGPTPWVEASTLGGHPHALPSSWLTVCRGPARPRLLVVLPQGFPMTLVSSGAWIPVCRPPTLQTL